MGIYGDQSNQLKNIYATLPMDDAYKQWFTKAGDWKVEQSGENIRAALHQIGVECRKDSQKISNLLAKLQRIVRK